MSSKRTNAAVTSTDMESGTSKGSKRKNSEVSLQCKKANIEEVKDYGVFTEDKIPEDVFSIGDCVFVSTKIFRGKAAVHIRRFNKFGKTYYPTKEGVTLQPWWIEDIMGRQKLPKTERDLQESVYLPGDQIKIESSDFENFKLTRITESKSGETIYKSITITSNQWKQMMEQYKTISTVVSNYLFCSMNFMEAYNQVCQVPIEESLPESLDVSLGRHYLLEVLQSSLCEYIKENSGMKDPELIDCEEICANRVETFNTAALVLDLNQIVHYFNNNIWEDQPFLTLKPAMYVTSEFLKMIRLDHILKQVRDRLCPSNACEFFEDVL